jgi:D-ribose pyranase
MRSVLGDIPIRRIPHDAFKKMTHSDSNVFFVRTGETTPFANIILVSGVTFPAKGGKA